MLHVAANLSNNGSVQLWQRKGSETGGNAVNDNNNKQSQRYRMQRKASIAVDSIRSNAKD